MGKPSKYQEAFLTKRGRPLPADAAAARRRIRQPDKTPEAPPPPPAATEAGGKVRDGYRDEAGVWHPSPTSKSFLKHFSECQSCGLEAKALGLKAEA